MSLDDFELVAELHRSSRVNVSRYRARADGSAVVIKALPPDQQHHHAIARLRYEYRILKHLNDNHTAHVPRALALIERPGVVALVLADAGAEALAHLYKREHLTLGEILHIARQLATTLVDIHRHRIVHKDINPNNIIYNKSNRDIQLIDFDLASQLRRELQSVDNLAALEGTVNYISPEQTGRLSRALDYRTDFFSLGATLYELLTGTLPFEGTDLAQLIYSILAKAPPDPCKLNPALPQVVGRIVLRLLEKDPEHRYKSAEGLREDLTTCCTRLTRDGTIADFELGTTDRSERFEIPQRLYGREAEVAALLAAYQRVASGHREMLFVAGPSGVGKSALVRELQASILEHNGLFAAGKYEPLRRHLPFNALAYAIDGVVRRLLMEPDTSRERWRRRLQEAVGNIGQAMVEMVPTLTLLLGEQKSIPALAPQETENRLLLLLRNFLFALSKTQPLVLFLDDLQWVDSGTLKLLKRLAADEDTTARILLIGAYRDEEVTDQHPLHTSIRDLNSPTCSFHTVAIAPMTLTAVTALVRDATTAPEEPSRTLATLLLEKTAGVPLFVHEFVKSLQSSDLITYESTAKYWTWDLDKIRAATVTANVAALLATSFEALSSRAQTLLSLAACISCEFTLTSVCEVALMPRSEITSALGEALAGGLLLPVGGSYRYATDDDAEVVYRFAHDQIQQNAYDRQTPEQMQSNHYAIARRMLANGSDAEPERWVLQAADHLNRARTLINDPAERIEAARLNYLAAKQARLAAAYQVSIAYANASLAFLGDTAWVEHKRLTTDVYVTLAQAHTMAGESETADNYLRLLLERSQSLPERIDLYKQRISLMCIAREGPRVIETSIEALRLCGYNARPHAGRGGILWAFLRLQWALRGRGIESLVNLPVASDERAIMEESLLRVAAEGAITFLDTSLWVTCVLHAARLMVQHGFMLRTSVQVGMIVITTVAGQYDAAAAWVKVVRARMARWPNPVDTARSGFVLAAYIDHLNTPPSVLITQFSDAAMNAHECGEQFMAAHSKTSEIFVTSSLSLETCQSLAEHASPLMAESHDFNAHTNDAMRLLCCCLRGQLPSDSLADSFAAYLARHGHRQMPVASLEGPFNFAATVVEVIHRAPDAALAAANRTVQQGVFDVCSDHIVVMFSFYAAIACLMQPEGQRPAWWRRACNKMRRAAAAGPAIYGGMPVLINAELAAQRGALAEAELLYESAITQLTASGYTSFAAVALECAGRFYHRRGLHTAAAIFMQKARKGYLAWGAQRKIELLNTEFASYLGLSAAETLRPDQVATSRSASQRGSAAPLDLSAIMTVAQSLTAEMVLDKLVEKILETMRQCSAATRAVLLLKDADKFEHTADTESNKAGLPYQLIYYVERTQEPLVINDSRQGIDIKDDYFRTAQPKAVLCAPIMRQNKCKAVIYLENDLSGGIFNDDRINLVKLLAAQAAIALENARLYAHLEDEVERRTQDLQRAHARLLQLERSTAELQMAGGFAHEMRNALSTAGYPLSAIRGANSDEQEGLYQVITDGFNTLATMLTQGAPPSDVTAIIEQLRQHVTTLDELLGSISRGVERGLRITEEILNYAQVGYLIVGDDVVSVSSVMAKVTDEFRDRLHKHDISLVYKTQQPLWLPMKGEHAYTILRNLVANAIDAIIAMPDPTRRRIIVSAEEQAGKLVLSVSDSGGGIPADVQPRIFQPFYSTKGTRGTGLGLSLCKKLIQAYGGDIYFTAEERQGTKFVVSLTAADTAG